MGKWLSDWVSGWVRGWTRVGVGGQSGKKTAVTLWVTVVFILSLFTKIKKTAVTHRNLNRF